MCLCPGLGWRILSICGWCLSDKAKQLFEWGNMHCNKSANISPSVLLQMSPWLYRWDIFVLLSLFVPFSESVHLSPGNRLLSPNLYTQLWNAGYGMRNDWFLNLNVWGKSDVKLAEADRYMVLTFLDILLYKHQPKSRHTKPRSAIVFWIFYYFKILSQSAVHMQDIWHGAFMLRANHKLYILTFVGGLKQKA